MEKLFTFLFAFLLVLSAEAQIAFQGFEGSAADTWAFTNNPATYNTGSDIWDNVSSVGNITSGATGTTNFWGMQDLDNNNGGGNFQHTLTFTQDVSAFTSVTVSFFYNVFEYDAGDNVDYELFYDGVSQGNVRLITGVNGGGTSTGGWVQEVVNVPDIVNTVILVLKADQNGGGDYAGWDNVEIDGIGSLPVELTNFTAKSMEDKAVVLNWTTASEENNEYFVVEHSDDGTEFEEVDLVKGNGTTYDVQNYTFMHEFPRNGNNYYRLRQVDYDGTYSYSSIRVVTLKLDNVFTFQPTIAKDYVNVALSERFNDDTAVLMVFDLSGRMVMSEQIAADSFTRLDVSGLTNGHYFVRLESDSGVETARFVKAN